MDSDEELKPDEAPLENVGKSADLILRGEDD